MGSTPAQAWVSAVGILKNVVVNGNAHGFVFFSLRGIIGMAYQHAFHVIVQVIPRNGYVARSLFNIEQPIVCVNANARANFAVQFVMVDPNVLPRFNN